MPVNNTRAIGRKDCKKADPLLEKVGGKVRREYDISDLPPLDRHRKRNADFRYAQKIDKPVRDPPERGLDDGRMTGGGGSAASETDGSRCPQRLHKRNERRCGSADDSSALLSASATSSGRTGTPARFLRSVGVVQRPVAIRSQNSAAATNSVPSGRNSRIRRERFFHIRSILTPVAKFSLSKQIRRPIYREEAR